MNFGDKVRQLRQEKGLTQPDLAGTMGIEQSYLSKLENNKSLPSSDMFNRILDVFGIGVGDLVDDLDPGVRNQLRQIPDVAEHLNDRKERTVRQRRRWIVTSSAMLALGAGLIFAGASHLFFPNIVYQYRSDGVVLEGESKEIFRHPQNSVSRSADSEELVRAIDAINARIDESFVQSTSFKGTVFNIPVDGGSRTYYLDEETEIDPWQNNAIVFAGLMSLIAGVMGLVFQNRAFV